MLNSSCEADSQTDIAYKNGALVKASSKQADNQSMHVSEYVKGNLEEDKTTPVHASRTYDFLPLIKATQPDGLPQTLEQIHQWQQVLSAMNSLIYLQAEPAELAKAMIIMNKAAEIVHEFHLHH
jgi:hypothetical protein